MEEIMTPNFKATLIFAFLMIAISLIYIFTELILPRLKMKMRISKISWHILSEKNKPKLGDRVLVLTKHESFACYGVSKQAFYTLWLKEGKLKWFSDCSDPDDDDGVDFNEVYAWAYEPDLTNLNNEMNKKENVKK